MSEKTQALRATIKAGAGYEVPWLTVDADSPAELEQRVRAVIDSKVLETVAEAASLFQATQNAAPLTQPQQGEQPAWSQAPAQQQAAPQQSGGWGAAQQQSAPQQQRPQGGGSRFGGPQHPEGKQCQCGKVLEVKQTGSNKTVFRCPDWRWNSGNPTPNHDSEWA